METTNGILEKLNSSLQQKITSAADITERHLAEEFAQRFLGLRRNPETPELAFLDVDSSGIGLREKIALERFALETLSPETDLRLSVFFKKKSQHRQYLRPNTAISTPKAVSEKTANLPGLNLARRKVPGVKNVLLVASGKGGVGKSTVAALVAQALLQRGQKVGLLDADLYGPSVPALFSLNEKLRVSSHNKLIPMQAAGLELVSSGLIIDTAAPLVWRGPMITKLLTRLFFEVEWTDIDTLVVDLPPGTGDVQLTILEQIEVAGTLMVTTPDELAYADVLRAATMFRKTHVPLIGLIENMAAAACEACGHKNAAADGVSRLAAQLGLDLLGSLARKSEYTAAALKCRLAESQLAGDDINPIIDAALLAMPTT